MKILHILRKPDDKTAIEIAKEQSCGNVVAILLMHDAVFSYVSDLGNIKIYASKRDVEARGAGGGFIQLDYEKIVELIFEYDKIVSW